MKVADRVDEGGDAGGAHQCVAFRRGRRAYRQVPVAGNLSVLRASEHVGRDGVGSTVGQMRLRQVFQGAYLLGLALLLLTVGACDRGTPRGEAVGGTPTSAPATAAATTGTVHFQTPAVPALRSGETPPTDPPNYFDARELGAATLVIYTTCVEELDAPNSAPTDEAKAAVCTCNADAARQNVRLGRPNPADLSDGQLRRCLSYGRASSGASPFAAGLPFSTAQIAGSFARCMDLLPADFPVEYGVRVCACGTDAGLKNAGPATANDMTRCDIAARYALNTGQNLTRRQFSALPGGSVSVPASPPASLPPTIIPPMSGPFIPYPGNGLGPTPCADGRWSMSSGEGTCSKHRGILGGRHRSW